MRYYIIAGEASGDLHGSNLIKAIREKDQQAEIRAWGGDKMEEAGADLVKHYRDLDFMGFIEVVKNLRTILGNIKICKQDILEYNPDVLVLIDYPGFNMRIAEFAKKKAIKVAYYISPQIWAWNQKRAYKLKRSVDRMLTILPFEKAFYKKFDMEVDYVGHPLLDAIENRDTSEDHQLQLKKEFNVEKKSLVLILPGSRKQEVTAVLPTMIQQANYFPEVKFTIAAAPSFDENFFKDYIKDLPNISVVQNRTYDLLQIADAAIVTSGTATLETALFKVPQVVCYKGSTVSYHIAKQLIKVNYISLVNLIMDKIVVKELIQNDFNPPLLKEELGKLLNNEEYKAEMSSNFGVLIDKLGGGGASTKAANIIIQEAKA